MFFNDVSLVLEGGGARCSFTAGVLDYFLEKELKFSLVIAVSAGALTGMNYISEQYKRFLSMVLDRSNIKIEKKDINRSEPNDMYKMIMNLNDNLSEFDFENFKDSEIKFLVSAIDAVSGENIYFDANNAENEIKLFKMISASCAIPGYAKPVMIDYQNYFDGGFSDAVPLFESLKRKYYKSVVVLTRKRGYKKQKEKVKGREREYLEKYPEIINCIENRYIKYNDTINVLNYMEKRGDAVVISPESNVELNALELNYSKTLELYRDGYQSAKKAYIAICNLSNLKDKWYD